MTYDELADAIESTTENHEDAFVTMIPVFVKQTEQRVFNSVQFPALRRNVTSSLTANSKYLNCPEDFLSVFELAVVDADGAYEYLINKDVSFIRQAYPTPTSVGTPKYYALFGPCSEDEKELTLIIGPTPDASYPVELHYFYYPESIVSAGNSWLGDNFDTVLLYGALWEAYVFMKGEKDVLDMYKERYVEALAMAKRLGDGMERGDAYRDGQAKVEVP
jgi:hypothetical protein